MCVQIGILVIAPAECSVFTLCLIELDRSRDSQQAKN